MSDQAAAPPQTRSHKLLSVIQAWLPVLTIVVGAMWGLYTYLDHQKDVQRQAALQAEKDNATRRIEVRKPFLEKQLSLYFEAAQIAGKLVTLTPDSEGWNGTESRFWALYWSELSMVEDKIVEEAMVRFGKVLFDYKATYKTARDKEEHKRPLYGASYELAHAIRSSIESGWGGNLSVSEPASAGTR